MESVFVVESDEAVRAGVARVAASLGARVQVFGSCQAFLSTLTTDPEPACVVLDVTLPDGDGLTLQRVLNESGGPWPIVFLTGGAATHTIVRAMKAGAVDVLDKLVCDSELREVLDAALVRARVLYEERHWTGELERRHATLTPREREVFALVTTGLSNKAIAWRLGVSEKMIKVHRARVVQKMLASSLADLVRMADRLGIGGAARAA